MWMFKVDSSSKLQFCIFVIFFSIVPFHLVFVVASKIKLITFYCSHFEWPEHYSNVIMSAMASQIISLTIIYWIVYSGADQMKHQSSASLAFERGIHRWPVNSPHKGPVTRRMFPFDDVVMIQHTDVSWTSWELIIFWSSSVDFPHFGGILALWIRPNLRFPGIFMRTQRGMASNLACWCILTTFKTD